MNQYQHDIFGSMHPTSSTDSIANNLRKMFNEDKELFRSDIDHIIWRYLQIYEGVGDAMSKEQYFSIPQLDSIRRILSDVKKEFSLKPTF